MNIAVIGAGYVGLVSGTCFAEIGVKVTCIDTDASKIKMLSAGKIPIFEPHLGAMVARNMSEGRLHFESRFGDFLGDVDVIFIAVGTPTDALTGGINTSYVENAARFIAPMLDNYTVIVNKSTVPIGTAEQVSKVISGVNKNAIFDVASNPEFLLSLIHI